MESHLTKLAAVTLLVVLAFSADAKEILTIGAIFADHNSTEEGALRFAVDTINNRTDLLPNHELRYIRTVAPLTASFANIQTMCKLFNTGVMTVIGPMSSTAVKASHPLNAGLHIPVISPSATDPMLENADQNKYLLRLQPPDSMQSRALVDFIKYFRWDTVAILTDNTDYGINGLVEFQKLASENMWRVMSVQQFVVQLDASLVDARQQLSSIKSTGARIILLNTYASMTEAVLDQAEELGMLNAGWVWVVTDGTTSFEALPDALFEKPYLEGVLGTRPDTYSGELFDEFMQSWSLANPDLYNGAGSMLSPPAYAPAFYDSVLVFAHAMHKLLEIENQDIKSSPTFCWNSTSIPWEHGSTVNQALREVDIPGVTRRLKFGPTGSPTTAIYDVVRLSQDGWIEYGVWSDTAGLDLNVTTLKGLQNKHVADIRDYVGDLVNKTLRVVTVIDPPFVFYDEQNEACKGNNSGNECFSGYTIDLLAALADKLSFKYELYAVADGKYGARETVSGTWSGLVAELIPDKHGNTAADLAAAAMTVSYDRQLVISFTKPYRDIQLGILLGTSPYAQYNMWSFLTPLSNELWGLIIGTAIIVSIVITLLDKLSPYGHHGKKAQIENETEQEAMDKNEDGTVDYWEMKDWSRDKNTMTWHNALLWAFASLFEQGGESHPKSWSARIAAGAWWFGALIIVQSYTANLAAFLTISVTADDVRMVEDLVGQTFIKYGTIEGSQVQDYFDTAKRTHLVEMANQMRAWDSYHNNSKGAFEATVSGHGNYAWLYDYPILEYWKGQNCSLQLAENGFGNFGYGFGLPKGSIFADELTIAIYQFREAGFMDSLDEKWILRTSVCDEEASSALDEETVEVTMKSLWGIFFIVYVGFGVSFVILIIEWLWSAYLAVDKSDKKKPQTYSASVYNRLRILKRDMLENWFPINFHKAEMKRRESSIRPLPQDLQQFIMRRPALAADQQTTDERGDGASSDKTEEEPAKSSRVMWHLGSMKAKNGDIAEDFM